MAALEDLFASGHRACAGCGCALTLKTLLRVTGPNVIIAEATGCMEVVSTPWPGERLEGALDPLAVRERRARWRRASRPRIRATGKKGDTKVIAIGGDGATFDIGFGNLSGVMERGHDILYLCYDNEAYMNTGIQRSGSTPYDASTTTTPSGKISFGNSAAKEEHTRDHGRPWHPVCGHDVHRLPGGLHQEDPESAIHRRPQVYSGARDLHARLGRRQRHVHRSTAPGGGDWPCTRCSSTRTARSSSVHKIKDRKPVREYLEKQKRFSHLFKMPGGDKEIEKIQHLADLNAEHFGLDVKSPEARSKAE